MTNVYIGIYMRKIHLYLYVNTHIHKIIRIYRDSVTHTSPSFSPIFKHTYT